MLAVRPAALVNGPVHGLTFVLRGIGERKTVWRSLSPTLFLFTILSISAAAAGEGAHTYQLPQFAHVAASHAHASSQPGANNVSTVSTAAGVDFDVGHGTPPQSVFANHALPQDVAPLQYRATNPAADIAVYDRKHARPTQRPLVELGRPFYGEGMLPPNRDWFGATNPTLSHFYIYGDFRTGYAIGRNDSGEINRLASRLNLDIDWQLTATERLHALVNPLNRGANFTHLDFASGPVEFNEFFNVNFVTGYFEGDLGAILGGVDGTPAAFDLPFAVGLVPLIMQNGIWFEDAIAGAAVSFPWRHSRVLDISNFDLTFFAGLDQLNSAAFPVNNSQTRVFGAALFADAYQGYLEAGWAHLLDADDAGRSYHNLTLAFTRRYFDRLSNSVRMIFNTGQQLSGAQRTAHGGLFLLENSLITARPNTVVPYLNLFYGWGRPQSVARSAFSGGILRNTGINFETDGLTGYPTLDATGSGAWGGAAGINLLGKGFYDQLILETAYVHPYAAEALPPGDQLAFGGRYQRPLDHRSLIRFDLMYGVRRSQRDILGSRIEWRIKF